MSNKRSYCLLLPGVSHHYTAGDHARHRLEFVPRPVSEMAIRKTSNSAFIGVRTAALRNGR